MAGTSLDGLDAVAVHFEPELEVLGHAHSAFDETLREALRGLAEGTLAGEVERLGDLDVRIGDESARLVGALLKTLSLDADDVAAIGSHGVTVRHRPQRGFSLQIGDPNRIAAGAGIAVVSDFRRADMACGGQGAPLASTLHAALWQREDAHTGVLNLGGFGNLSFIPARAGGPPPLASDTGPANTLLDLWHRRFRGGGFDPEGQWARSGRLIEPLLRKLLEHDYFARSAPKSTGREDFNLDWLEAHLSGSERPEDVQRTLLQLTVEGVMHLTRLLEASCGRIIVCGGGAHNRFLMETLAERINTPLISSAEVGLPVDQVEAAAFAYLAHLRLKGVSGVYSDTTGARRPAVLGGVWLPPGA
ncbi:MAG: anhydro-N-acetylmuramic acid kinase [Gammaproteobacteria bacterium AqS3]|nr:anhydro-N-acetylmuramic acid kinase [Gammaproteobacteria bacterium AqS3]